jgi:hypothetical protein
MVKAFTKGLTHSANGEEPGMFGDPTEFPTLVIRQAITSQTRIVLQGFIAKEWEQIYELSAVRTECSFTEIGQTWCILHCLHSLAAH